MTIIGFALIMLLISSFLCLYRIGKGPSAPDRAVGIDIFGTLIVGFCTIVAFAEGHDFYLNIAIAWTLISFIGSIALAKYLEGKHFDE